MKKNFPAYSFWILARYIWQKLEILFFIEDEFCNFKSPRYFENNWSGNQMFSKKYITIKHAEIEINTSIISARTKYSTISRKKGKISLVSQTAIIIHMKWSYYTVDKIIFRRKGCLWNFQVLYGDFTEKIFIRKWMLSLLN